MKIVIRNAAVLPVPGLRLARDVLAAERERQVASWIGVQCVKPAARTPADHRFGQVEAR